MSVLQDMTKDIMTTKATKASKLTAVAGESGMTVASVAATLPADLPGLFMSGEQLSAASVKLREYAALLLQAADGIDVLNGVPAAVAADAEKKAALEASLAEREKQRQADDRAKAAAGDTRAAARVAAVEEANANEEDLTQRLARLSAEAQAAVFQAADDDGQPESPFNDLPHERPTPDGWVCPDHGAKSLTSVTPRKGDPYLMCGVGDCEEFEK